MKLIGNFTCSNEMTNKLIIGIVLFIEYVYENNLIQVEALIL